MDLVAIDVASASGQWPPPFDDWSDREWFRAYNDSTLRLEKAKRIKIVSAKYGSPVEIVMAITTGGIGMASFGLVVAKVLSTLATTKKTLAEAREITERADRAQMVFHQMAGEEVPRPPSQMVAPVRVKVSQELDSDPSSQRRIIEALDTPEGTQMLIAIGTSKVTFEILEM